MKKKVQKCKPFLLTSMFSSMLIAGLTARVSARGIYQEYDTYGSSQPSVTVLMEGLSHHVYPWDSREQDSLPGQTQLADADSVQIPVIGLPGTVSDRLSGQTEPKQATGSPSVDSSGIHTTSDEPDTNAEPGQQNAADTETEQEIDAENSVQPVEPVQYAYKEVSQDYFDDAVFLGDSRAVGIQLYSGWDNMTYYADSGMTVYNLFTRQVTDKDGAKTTIEEALQEQSFGKVYLEIGINEMGTGTVDSFMEAYEDALHHLQELQPDADIFLCGIMYVRKSKSDSDTIFNNPNIRERNERIARLADQNTVFYLDINEVTSDEDGNLNSDYTWDEIHLLGKYNVLWTEYLSSHGIVKEQFP